MADSDKNILITPNISATAYPQIKFVGKDNAPMYQTVQDDGTISFSGAQGEVFSIGPSMALGTIFSANDISGVPLFKVLSTGTVNVASGRLAIGTDTAVDGMALTLNGDGTSYEGIAFQVDGSTKWKLSTDSSGFYWDSQVNNMDLNFRIRDSGSNQNYFRMTADGGTIGPKFVVGANAHTIPDSQAGIEVTDAGQANLRVTDSSASASSDFAQSENDLYIVNRKANGDIKFRVNESTEIMTFDGQNARVGISDTTPSTKLDVDGTISGTGHRGLAPYYFKANLNNSSSITGRKDLSTTSSDVTIDWYTTTYTDNSSAAYFSHSTSNRSRIVVEKDGLYTVNYNIAWDNTGPNRATLYASVWINGYERDETKSYGYSRGSAYGDKNNCVGSYTERFAADDYIEIKCRGIDFDASSEEVYTINDECTIQVYGWPDRGT